MTRHGTQSHNSRLGEHLENAAGIIIGLLSTAMLASLFFLDGIG